MMHESVNIKELEKALNVGWFPVYFYLDENTIKFDCIYPSRLSDGKVYFMEIEWDEKNKVETILKLLKKRYSEFNKEILKNIKELKEDIYE